MFKVMLFVFVYGASPLVIERELHQPVVSFEECENIVLPAVREALNRQKKNYLAYCRSI